MTETLHREKFSDFAESDVDEADAFLFRYRIRSLDILRRTDKDPRTFLAQDLRDIERLSFPEIRFIFQLFAHILPLQSRLKQGKAVAIEEIVAPDKLLQLRSDLSSVGVGLITSQAMANAITLELTVGRNKVPSYTPSLSLSWIRNRGATLALTTRPPSIDGKKIPAARTAPAPLYPSPFKLGAFITFAFSSRGCCAAIGLSSVASPRSYPISLSRSTSPRRKIFPPLYLTTAWCAPTSRNAHALGANVVLTPFHPILSTFRKPQV